MKKEIVKSKNRAWLVSDLGSSWLDAKKLPDIINISLTLKEPPRIVRAIYKWSGEYRAIYSDFCIEKKGKRQFVQRQELFRIYDLYDLECVKGGL